MIILGQSSWDEPRAIYHSAVFIDHLGARDIMVKTTDEPCPHGAYILKAGDTHTCYEKYYQENEWSNGIELGLANFL